MNSNEPVRVLYVEDNCDSFEMLEMMLGFSQIDVVCAASIDEALIRSSADRFDLYLLDSGFPDGDGLTLWSTLRAGYPNIPILFYSGNAHPDEINMGLAAGADGYITKPHSDRLAGTIIQLVANRCERPFLWTPLPVLAAAA